jgi:hypothetical protein
MIRPRDEDDGKPDPKRIKLVSAHPSDSPDIITGAGSPTNKRDDMVRGHSNITADSSCLPQWPTQAGSVSRTADTQNSCDPNSRPSDTMAPDRKPEDSDSEGPSEEVLRRHEKFRALMAHAKQRREDHERIHGPPIPPSPPRQYTPEEREILRRRQPKRRAAMQLLLNAARAAFDSFNNPTGTHVISIYAQMTTTI